MVVLARATLYDLVCITQCYVDIVTSNLNAKKRRETNNNHLLGIMKLVRMGCPPSLGSVKITRPGKFDLTGRQFRQGKHMIIAVIVFEKLHFQE